MSVPQVSVSDRNAAVPRILRIFLPIDQCDSAGKHRASCVITPNARALFLFVAVAVIALCFIF